MENQRKIVLSSENKWYLILGLILLFLVTKEALVLPLTHDEGNTIYCSTTSIWDIVSYKDPVPNNHILNTLLIKVNQFVFSENLFIARLHNVLSFLPFYIFTIAIAYKLFDSVWLRIFFIFSLVLQPFILDFFSVTRGYGLSLSFMMVSMFYFIKSIQGGTSKDLMWSVLWAAIGVYANFTLLNYFIPMCLFLGYDNYIKNWSFDRKKWIQGVINIVTIGVILLLIIAVPVYKMVSTKQFVYWGTKGFFEDTVKNLIISLRTGVDYFSLPNEWIYGIGVSIVSITLVAANIVNWKNRKGNLLWPMTILLLATATYNQLQFYIFDVPFLNARTALFFVPLVAVPFALSLQIFFERYKTWPMVIILLLLTFQVQHFIRGYSVNGNFEWYYDQNTYQVLDEIKAMVEKGQAPKPVKINCYWIFYPSMSYHVANGYAEYIQIAPWGVKIKDDAESVFYYTEAGEKDQIADKFDILKDFGYGARFLMRAKGK